VGPVTATVFYWFGNGTVQNLTMTGPTPFTAAINIASGSLARLHYFFRVEDGNFNVLWTAQTNVPVLDNDPPVYVGQSSGTEAMTGEVFNFNATFTDNIAVTGVWVHYWFGNGTVVEKNIYGPTFYDLNIRIPYDSTETLHYYFTAVDAAGNSVQSAQSDVAVEDIIAPVNLEDIGAPGAEAKETYTFTLDAEDNVGIVEAYVVYSVNGSAPTNASMELVDGQWQLPIELDAAASGDLTYHFVVKDADDNWAASEEETVPITPVEQPEPKFTTMEISFLILMIIFAVLFLLMLMMYLRKGKEEPVEEQPETDEADGQPPAEEDIDQPQADVVPPAAAPMEAGEGPVDEPVDEPVILEGIDDDE